MVATVEALCAETHNYFDTHREFGIFTIKDGVISLPFLEIGQFFRIVGSKWNDGVYIYDGQFIVRSKTWEELTDKTWESIKDKSWGDLVEHDLVDESFRGAIWAMNMPRAFLDLSREISVYCESEMAKPSPYQSESFAGYSYTKATNASGVADNSWQNVFKTKIDRFRKMAMSC